MPKKRIESETTVSVETPDNEETIIVVETSDIVQEPIEDIPVDEMPIPSKENHFIKSNRDTESAGITLCTGR